MVKKISILVFASFIIVTGIIAMRRVSFIDRSIRIFNLSAIQNQPGMGRDRGGFEGRERFKEGQNFRRGDRPGVFADSLRRGFEGRIPPQGRMERNIPDSLRRQFENRERIGGREGEMMGGREFERGGHGNGSKINLGPVGWYMAVFTLFTLLAVYSDKALLYLKKIKKG